MRTLALATMIGMLTCTATGQLSAQDDPLRVQADDRASADGLDGFFDWIHKLSGPKFSGKGGSFTTERLTRSGLGRGWSLRLRGTLARHEAEDYTPPTSSDTVTLRMTTGELAAEIGKRSVSRLYIVPEFGIGASLHSFSAEDDAIDGFTHFSFPIYIQLRVPTLGPLMFKAGGGVRIFPPFSDDAFAPLTNVVEKEWEAPLFGFVGFGFKLGGP